MVNIKALNKSWNTKFNNVWRKEHPVNQSYLKFAGQKLKKAIGEGDCVNPIYKDIDINYDINQYGFRNHSNYIPQTDKKVFAFGCSMTFGAGIPEEHTWPQLLAEKLGGWQIYNYGIPASSSAQTARTCYQVLQNLEKKDYPDAVFILLPDIFRTEYLGNEGKNLINASLNIFQQQNGTLQDSTKKLTEQVNTEDPLQYIVNPDNLVEGRKYHYYKYTSAVYSFFETVRSVILIKEVCEARNIPWFWYTWAPVFYSLKLSTIDTYLGSSNTITDENGLVILKRDTGARDGTHVGLLYNNNLSNAFANLYKNYENNKNHF